MDILDRFKRRESVIRCGNHYASIVESLADREKISPISLEIIRNVNPEQKLWACLLLLSLNRFEEIHTTNWTTWCSGVSQVIFMPKVKAYKKLPGLTLEDLEARTHPDPTPHEAYLRYKSVARAIKKALPRAVVKELTCNKIYTHVFRHVETSFHLHLNRSEQAIRARLGHRNRETLLAYKHSKLFI